MKGFVDRFEACLYLSDKFGNTMSKAAKLNIYIKRHIHYEEGIKTSYVSRLLEELDDSVSELKGAWAEYVIEAEEHKSKK